jgi:hypothetical protein
MVSFSLLSFSLLETHRRDSDEPFTFWKSLRLDCFRLYLSGETKTFWISDVIKPTGLRGRASIWACQSMPETGPGPGWGLTSRPGLNIIEKF